MCGCTRSLKESAEQGTTRLYKDGFFAALRMTATNVVGYIPAGSVYHVLGGRPHTFVIGLPRKLAVMLSAAKHPSPAARLP